MRCCGWPPRRRATRTASPSSRARAGPWPARWRAHSSAPASPASPGVAVRELLLANPVVGNLIREGKTHQLYNVIETAGRAGMISMDRALANLVRDRKIRMEDAVAKANDPEVMKRYLGTTRPVAAGPVASPAGWR